MTPRERLAAILAHKPYDHFGICESFWGETLRDAWPAQGYPKDTDPATYFGYDLVGIGGGPDAKPFREPEPILRETDEWKITRSGWGAELKYWKHHSGTPEHVAFAIKTPADWLPYRAQLDGVTDPSRFGLDSIRENYAKKKVNGDKFTVYSQLFVFEIMRHSLGDVTMLESLIAEPEWIHDFCRVLTDFYKRHMDLLFREVGKPDAMFVYEDLGFTNGLFASPRTLDTVVFPYYRELVDYYHGLGIPVILHSCGGITEAVPYIVDIGFDCLQPLESKAKVSAVDIAKKYGDRLAVFGNIDVTILNTNDRAKVKAHVLGMLNALYDLGAGYIFHSDHSIPPDVHFDTYRYAVDLYRDFCATHPMGG